MTRKAEIPELQDKVLYVGSKHSLGATVTAIAKRIGFAGKTLTEAISGEQMRRRKGLTPTLRDDLAVRLGIGPTWDEFFDRENKGRDTLAAFIDKYGRDGSLPPCLKAPDDTGIRPPTPPPSSSLTSERVGRAQAVDPQLCSVMLFGGQYDAHDLDIELAALPSKMTILDEAGRRILVQREIVISACTLILDLGGAEIHGGLDAVRRAVEQFLSRETASNLIITVGGSAAEPRLVIQARVGSIGMLRPFVKPGEGLEAEPVPLVWLKGLLPDGQVIARVKVYGTDLQDRDDQTNAVAGANRDDPDEPPPISRSSGTSLACDDRVLIMRRMWELAKAKELDPRDNRPPGEITLAFDMRIFRERT